LFLQLLDNLLLVVTILGRFVEALLLIALLSKLLYAFLEVVDALLKLVALENDLPLLPLSIHYFVLLFIDFARQEVVERLVVDFQSKINVLELPV
jgi:hypothetical protein